MSPPSSPEPEGTSPRDLRRAERRAMNTEAFPEFAEPTLVPDSEIDQIVDLRTRSAATKPTMRVDATMLRGSGLMGTLPEFLGQLARANLETETMLASNPDGVRFELDDDQAASQQHVEMNLFSGLIKSQRRRQRESIVLPGDLAVQAPTSTEEDSTDTEDSGDETDSSTSTTASLQANIKKRKAAAVEDEDDSSDESDASTSTTASLQANLKKRKTSPLEDSEDSEEASPPNKIRLQYNYPTPKLRHFDMKRRKLVTRANPAAAPNDPFEALLKTPAPSANKPIASITSADRPTSSSSNSSSSSSGPVPITKIRVPSRSPDGSRSTSPDRIILLRHPVLSQSSREGSASLEEAGSSGSSTGSGRRLKIKVVQKERREGEGRKRLIEEVE